MIFPSDSEAVGSPLTSAASDVMSTNTNATQDSSIVSNSCFYHQKHFFNVPGIKISE